MRIWEVSIHPRTTWTTRVKAKNEEEAKEKALSLDGPALYAHLSLEDLDEWNHDILEWPNIGSGIVDIVEL